MKNNTQGFTLIELLIVIAIIGILAAVLIPNLLGARSSAQKTAGQAWGRQMLTAAQAQLAGGTVIAGMTAAGTTSVACSVGITEGIPANIGSPAMTAADNCKVNRDGAIAVMYVIGGTTYSWNSLLNTVVATNANFTGATGF